MSVRYLLHIGANKTGTSSVQKMLVGNPRVLAEAGWIYPDFHLRHCAHHGLAYALEGHGSRGLPPGWRAEFAGRVADPGLRVVISSELFFRQVPPERAAELFPPRQTRVVLYLRDHMAYMMSWYAQAVQERNLTASFQDYLRLFPQSFDGYLKRWEAVFPDIVVRPFRRDALAGGDIRTDFLEVMGGVPGMVLPDEDSNLSMSGNLLAFKRMLNMVMTYAEASSAPLPDEFGAYAGLKPEFQGRFQAGADAAALVSHLFGADRKALDARGLDLGSPPDPLKGWPVPDLDTFQGDVDLIRQVALETNKRFVPYAKRLPVWGRD